MDEEQKARLQEMKDDAAHAYRFEYNDDERRALRTKVETLEAIAYVFGVELKPSPV